MLNITFRQLKIFESVSRHLSFSRAAEELHLTQPAVSMQVRSLEEAAGVPLTEQVGKRIHLTAAGDEMAGHARRMAQLLRELEETMVQLRGARGGRIVIGIVSTAKYFAPRMLAAFRRNHPQVELRIEVHNRERVVELLGDNRIDVAIMGRPPQAYETVSEAFADHPLIFVAEPEHPLVGRERIEPKELAGEAFLIRESGSGTRTTMEDYLRQHGIKPRSAFEMSSNETIKQAVMAGMGIAFISAHTCGLELQAQRLMPLAVTGTPVLRQWFVVRRAEKRVLPALNDFINFLRDEGAQHIQAHIGVIPPVVGAPRRERPQKGLATQ
ncbi:MAG: LysR family transcriptional regulator [Sterolibacteriaceae bacterium]|nr:LysR family transcriptional regulator [Candidatus Methylophosphatis haderslevensis]